MIVTTNKHCIRGLLQLLSDLFQPMGVVQLRADAVPWHNQQDLHGLHHRADDHRRPSGRSNISLTVPNAQITYSSTCTNSTTTFSNNTWVTTCPLGSTLTGDQFGSALAYKMPFASGGGGNLTWSCNFSVPSSVPVNWKWGACVYTNLSNTYTNLGVKPVDDSTRCGYRIAMSPAHLRTTSNV